MPPLVICSATFTYYVFLSLVHDSSSAFMFAHLAVPSTVHLHTTHTGNIMTLPPSTLNLHFPVFHVSVGSTNSHISLLIPHSGCFMPSCQVPFAPPSKRSQTRPCLTFFITTTQSAPGSLQWVSSVLSPLWNLKYMVGRGNLFSDHTGPLASNKKGTCRSPCVMGWDWNGPLLHLALAASSQFLAHIRAFHIAGVSPLWALPLLFWDLGLTYFVDSFLTKSPYSW